MPVYIRAYVDNSFEMILSEGRFKKTRIHLLINPNEKVKLQGQSQGQAQNTEVNVDSLTHIISMETSVKNEKKILQAKKYAELTNKPIITNPKTAEIFREQGISAKQLRIIGFEEEVIDKLSIDPIYKEELDGVLDKSTVEQGDEPRSETDDKVSLIGFATSVGKLVSKTLDPRKWTKKIKDTVTTVNKPEIDPTKPLALHIKIRKHDSVLFPLDSRGIEHTSQIIARLKPQIVLLPGVEISKTLDLGQGAKKVVIIHDSHDSEKILHIPKTYNPSISHDTIYGSFMEWIQVQD